jgi:hypothetical protein
MELIFVALVVVLAAAAVRPVIRPWRRRGELVTAWASCVGITVLSVVMRDAPAYASLAFGLSLGITVVVWAERVARRPCPRLPAAARRRVVVLEWTSVMMATAGTLGWFWYWGNGSSSIAVMAGVFTVVAYGTYAMERMMLRTPGSTAGT